MGQLLSLPMLAFGLFLVVRGRRRVEAPGLSELEDRLRRLILDHGPISVARYMALALAHPTRRLLPAPRSAGCGRRLRHRARDQPAVRRADRPGAGAALARSRPARRAWRWSSSGPGRGTLMADALRAARVVPAFLRGRERSIWSRPARSCASGRPRPCPACRCTGTTSWPACRRTGRCCWSPTSSWTRCRSGSSSARSGRWHERLVGVDEDGAFRLRAGDRARRRSREAVGEVRGRTARRHAAGAGAGPRGAGRGARRCGSWHRAGWRC